MNIKQALDRLNAIEEAQGQASILSTLLSRRNSQAPKGVHVQVYGAEGDRHSSANGRYCVIDADSCRRQSSKPQSATPPRRQNCNPSLIWLRLRSKAS